MTVDLSNNALGSVPFQAGGTCQLFDDDGSQHFNRSFGTRGSTELGATATGFVVAGDPSVTPGLGTFAIAPGVDPLTGGPCGTGLGTHDGQWINVDGAALGATATSCPASSAGGPIGTGCYFAGGWPQQPYADLYQRIWATPSLCSVPACQGTYCTAKPSSSSCLATLSLSGSAPRAPARATSRS